MSRLFRKSNNGPKVTQPLLSQLPDSHSDYHTDNNAHGQKSLNQSLEDVSLDSSKVPPLEPNSRVPVDRGWAWVIVLASFTVSFLNLGAIKSFGVLFVEFSDKYNASPDAATSITALNGFLALFLAPFATALGKRFSNRAVIIVGGLLVFLGYVLSAFVVYLPHLYITFGLIAGTGEGLCFAPSVVILGDYFRTRRSVANGLAIAGSGVGSFIIPPLYQYLIDTYELKGAMLIFGALTLNICVSGLAMTPKEFYNYSTKRPLKDEFETEASLFNGENSIQLSSFSGSRSQSINVIQNESRVGPSIFRRIYMCICFLPADDDGHRKPLFDWTVFKSPIYYVYAVAMMFAAMAYPSMFIIVPPFAVEEGVSRTSAALLVSCIGLADLTGRVGLGFLLDYNFIPKKYVFFGSFFICSVSCMLFSFADQIGWMVAVGVVFGLFGGTYLSLNAVMFVEALGVDKLASAYGFAMLNNGVALLVAMPLMGVLREATGSWAASFWACAVAFLLASLCGLFEPIASRHSSRANFTE